MSRDKFKAFAAMGILSSISALAGCNAAPPPPVAAAPAPPAPGVVGTAIGQSLDEADKEKAIAAQAEAVSSGSRKTWRGERGSYGFIVPGPETANCRDYTHKIFINGRPQEAKGQACRGPDGGWRVTS